MSRWDPDCFLAPNILVSIHSSEMCWVKKKLIICDVPPLVLAWSSSSARLANEQVVTAKVLPVCSVINYPLPFALFCADTVVVPTVLFGLFSSAVGVVYAKVTNFCSVSLSAGLV